jgi:hypothetical protein
MIGVYRRARRDLELQFGFALPSVKGGGVVNMSVFVDFEDSRQAEYSVRPEFPMDMPAEEIDAISMWYSLKT